MPTWKQTRGYLTDGADICVAAPQVPYNEGTLQRRESWGNMHLRLARLRRHNVAGASRRVGKRGLIADLHSPPNSPSWGKRTYAVPPRVALTKKCEKLRLRLAHKTAKKYHSKSPAPAVVGSTNLSSCVSDALPSPIIPLPPVRPKAIMGTGQRDCSLEAAGERKIEVHVGASKTHVPRRTKTPKSQSDGERQRAHLNKKISDLLRIVDQMNQIADADIDWFGEHKLQTRLRIARWSSKTILSRATRHYRRTLGWVMSEVRSYRFEKAREHLRREIRWLGELDMDGQKAAPPLAEPKFQIAPEDYFPFANKEALGKPRLLLRLGDDKIVIGREYKGIGHGGNRNYTSGQRVVQVNADRSFLFKEAAEITDFANYFGFGKKG